LTQGKATFKAVFSSYEPVPENIQQTLVKELEAV
jgi:translation elongation factor EF-G